MKTQNSVPTALMYCIKPFLRLIITNYSSALIWGKNSNSNKYFSIFVWKICPKTCAYGKIILEIAANKVVITFNERKKGRIKVMNVLRLKSGQYVLDANRKCGC